MKFPKMSNIKKFTCIEEKEKCSTTYKPQKWEEN
jgi:hypothetical protein